MAESKPKSPGKVTLECPHCNVKQQDYAAAKSTMCRSCGLHFNTHEGIPENKKNVRKKGRLASFLSNPVTSPKQLKITCYECGHVCTVSAKAQTSICAGCSTHMELQDLKINSAFSRNIRTHGRIHITAKGKFASSQGVARDALIQGPVNGTLQVLNECVIKYNGKITGQIKANKMIIDKRCKVTFFQPVKVRELEIRGHMSSVKIYAAGTVRIFKKGWVDGEIEARGFVVEKGGNYSGSMTIGKVDTVAEQQELFDLRPKKKGKNDHPESGTPNLKLRTGTT